MTAAEILTVLFTDLVGSTELLDRLGEEAAEEVRRSHFAVLRAALAAAGGDEVKNLGDGLMAVFPSAVDAVRCAVAIQDAVDAHNRGHDGPALSVRVGLHLGEPMRAEDDYFGTAVVVAKRLCDRARGGQILASQLVADLVRNRRGFRFRRLGPLHLKGLREAIPTVGVEADRSSGLNGAGSPPVAVPGPPPTTSFGVVPAPWAGCEAELGLLAAELAWSGAGQFRCCLVTGASGEATTALLGEFVARHGHDRLVLCTRAHGFDDGPFGLWCRALDRHLRGLDPGEMLELCGPFLDDLTGVLRSAGALRGSVGGPGPGGALDGLTAVLSGLAARAPVVVVLDELQRADDGFWQALEHFAHQLVDDRILVVAAAREGELDGRPGPGEVMRRLEGDGLLRRMALPPSGPGTAEDGVPGPPTVPPEPAALMEAAQRALAAGDFDAAVASLTEVVAASDAPQAHDLLGGLCHAMDDLVEARRHWEIAFRGYRDAGDLRAATRAAIRLGQLHYSGLGHEAVSRGWLGRARRLVDQVGHCVERGWLELALVACDVRDVSALEASAALALELAVEFGDSALEARALADSGLALVTQGRVAEGFARLDEAMVPVIAGELSDPMTPGLVFCAMLSACDRAGDIRRAEEWSRLCRETLPDPSEGRKLILHAHCRIVYGNVLCSVGRWPEAEAEMLRVLGPSGTRHVTKRVEAVAQLAGLRLRQGRPEEAAELLAPVEDRFEVADPLARLHLARGEFDLAAAVINGALNELVGDRLRTGPLLAILVDVELARGDTAAAQAAAARLTECSQKAESPVLRAHAARAAGLVAVRRGAHTHASEAFQAARRELADQEQPLLLATVRLEDAEARAAAGDRDGAVAEARAALAQFQLIGASTDANRAASCLRRLDARDPAAPQDRTAAFSRLNRREEDVLALLRQGLTNAEIGNRLCITAKTVEHHVSRILTKLGVRTRTEAATAAAAHMAAAPA